MCTYKVVLGESVGAGAGGAARTEQTELGRLAVVLTAVADESLLSVLLHDEHVREPRQALGQVRAVAPTELVHAQDVVRVIGGHEQAVLEHF